MWIGLIDIQINNTYGQGSTDKSISDEFAEYALNLAATNIVLLVRIYKRGKVEEGLCRFIMIFMAII